MSEGMAMLLRRTDCPPRGGLVRLAHWAKRAYTSPSAYRKLTASRLPVSNCWTSAASEARHAVEAVTRLGGSDRELGTQPRSVPSVPQPGFAWFDHRRESDVVQRGRYISGVAHDNLARDLQPEAPRHRDRALLAVRDRQRRLGRESHADPWLEAGAMPAQQRDRGVV